MIVLANGPARQLVALDPKYPSVSQVTPNSVLEDSVVTIQS